jgi:hypothetical protein
MFNVFRPSFEVVKEGRILREIKHLQTQIVFVFFGASLMSGFDCKRIASVR